MISTSLGEQVDNLLKNSPSDNIFSRADLSPQRSLDNETQLDPELGIGVDEIVAAAVLALYTSEPTHAIQLARMAMQWCQGWMKIGSSSTSPTLGEMFGIIPIRQAQSAESIARLYLFSYVRLAIGLLANAR